MSVIKFSNKEPGRTIREEQSFKDAVEELGGAKKIDLARLIIDDALSNRPEGFDLVPGYEVRIAKTECITKNEVRIPPLRFWFKIIDEFTVSLLYVEEIPNGKE